MRVHSTTEALPEDDGTQLFDIERCPNCCPELQGCGQILDLRDKDRQLSRTVFLAGHYLMACGRLCPNRLRRVDHLFTHDRELIDSKVRWPEELKLWDAARLQSAE